MSEKKKYLRLLFWALVVTLAVSGAVAAVQYLQGQLGHEAYEQAQQITRPLQQETAPPAEAEPVPEPDSEPEPEVLKVVPVVQDAEIAAIMQTVDLSALQQVNEEVIGWLYIPGSEIPYPLMRHKDNTYYLTHNWKKENYIDGAIYMDCRNSMDGMDFNTIIYGHNKEDGFMFSNLVHYREQEYCDRYPYVYLSTPGGIFRYAVFSAHEVAADGYVYQLKNLEPTAFLAESLERSVIKTAVEVTQADRIISLSTCTGYWTDTRFVVQAVLDGIVAQ